MIKEGILELIRLILEGIKDPSELTEEEKIDLVKVWLENMRFCTMCHSKYEENGMISKNGINIYAQCSRCDNIDSVFLSKNGELRITSSHGYQTIISNIFKVISSELNELVDE